MVWIALEFGNSVYLRCIKQEGRGGDETIFMCHGSLYGLACLRIYCKFTCDMAADRKQDAPQELQLNLRCIWMFLCHRE